MYLEVKSVGKPCAGDPHARFDERGWETGLYATAPVLDSTIWRPLVNPIRGSNILAISFGVTF